MEQMKPISMLLKNKSIEGFYQIEDENYWIADSTYLNFICSACGGIAIKPYKTCPHCKNEITYIMEVNPNGCV